MPIHGVRLAPGLSTVSMRRATSVSGQGSWAVWGGAVLSEAGEGNQEATFGYVWLGVVHGVSGETCNMRLVYRLSFKS